MTSRDFAYWLQGFYEIGNPEIINKEQTQMIKKHLSLVFSYEIDPSMGNEKHQKELNSIHNSILMTEEEIAILKFGEKPSPEHELSRVYGWYNPKEGLPRC